MIIPEGQLISFDATQYTDDLGNEHCQLLMRDQLRRFQVQKEYTEVPPYAEYNATIVLETGTSSPINLTSVLADSYYFTMRSFTIEQESSSLTINELKIVHDAVELFDLKENQSIGDGTFNPAMYSYLHLICDIEGTIKLHLNYAVYDRLGAVTVDAWHKVTFSSFGESKIECLTQQFETSADTIDYVGYIDPGELEAGDWIPSQQTINGDIRNFRLYEEVAVEAYFVKCDGGADIGLNEPVSNATHLLYTFSDNISCFRIKLIDDSGELISNRFQVCAPNQRVLQKYSLVEVSNKEMCIGNNSIYPFDYTNHLYLYTSILNEYRKDQKIESLENYKRFKLNYQALTSRAVTMSIFKPVVVVLEPYLIEFFYLLLGRRFFIDGVEYQANEQDFLDKEDERFSKITLELDIYGKQSISK